MDIQKRTWKELNAYKASLKLSQEQREILAGGLLGDLSLRKIGKFSRLVVEQKNKDYLFHLYDIFSDYVRTPPQERLQKRLPTSEVKSTWYFSTISHSDFEEFYTIFYPNNKKKTLPKNVVDYLTPRSLAYWFMDDGTYNKSYYSFATANFSAEEHDIIVNVLAEKFGLHCSVYKSKYNNLVVTATNASNKKFKDLVNPYVVPSMKYKLGITC